MLVLLADTMCRRALEYAHQYYMLDTVAQLCADSWIAGKP